MPRQLSHASLSAKEVGAFGIHFVTQVAVSTEGRSGATTLRQLHLQMQHLVIAAVGALRIHLAAVAGWVCRQSAMASALLVKEDVTRFQTSTIAEPLATAFAEQQVSPIIELALLASNDSC